jgi:hypothetical protein
MVFVRANTPFIVNESCFWLLAISILLLISNTCKADDKGELAAMNGLIALIESDEAGQAEKAATLFKLVADDSKLKSASAYALSLIFIRERQFSDAWKALGTPTNNSDSDSILLGKERLRVWLLLEAGASGKAETQFDKLLNLTLSKDTSDGAQAVNCEFIGGVVGMLNTNASSASIPDATLEKATARILSKVESKIAKSKMEEKIAETKAWGDELSTLISKFESVGAEEAAEQNKATQTELESARQEQLKLRDDLKATGGDKRQLEEQRRKEIKDRKAVQENLQKEKQNKPQQPVAPGQQPRLPRQPEGGYQTDPKTQERKFVPPTEFEMKQFQMQLEVYNNWPVRVANYQKEVADYQNKVNQWQQRLDDIQKQVKSADAGIASIEKAMKDMQAGINQGVGKDLKEKGDQLDQIERSAVISDLAYKHIISKEARAKNPIRPSNFQLLDYGSESARLRKAIH